MAQQPDGSLIPGKDQKSRKLTAFVIVFAGVLTFLAIQTFGAKKETVLIRESGSGWEETKETAAETAKVQEESTGARQQEAAQRGRRI